MDLQSLKTELAEKLKVANEAKEALATAQAELDALVKANIEIRDATNRIEMLTMRKRSEDGHWKAAKSNATNELSAHFTEHPEAAKIEPAFGVRRSVEAVYEDEIEFIKAVIKSGMLFLLKPDDAAITTFVKGMAFEVDDPVMPHLLPEKVLNNLPVLGVQTIFKATISDKKLQS